MGITLSKGTDQGIIDPTCSLRLCNVGGTPQTWWTINADKDSIVIGYPTHSLALFCTRSLQTVRSDRPLLIVMS